MNKTNGWLVSVADLSHPDKPGCNAHDSAFALENGRFGCKGTVPGCPPGRMGTFIAGLLDDSRSYWDDTQDRHHVWIVPVAPNLWFTEFPGGRVDPSEWSRTLDLKQGVLSCEGVVHLPDGDWRLRMRRFLSWDNRNLACEELVCEPLEGAGPLELVVGLDDSARNRNKRHYFDAWRKRQLKTEATKSMVQWSGRTRGEGKAVEMVERFTAEGVVGAFRDAGPGRLALCAEGPFVLYRYLGLSSVVDAASPEAVATAASSAGLSSGFAPALTAHIAAVARFWERADVEIDGPIYDQRATRFCVFQIGGAMPDSNEWSYGAKLLAGPHYHGVVFWDVDLFILPYLTRMFPEKARLHLEFRYAGLAAARNKAQAFGYQGAMYPWNAGPGGQESSLGEFGDMELHITADVAWGVCDYVDWTGDSAFWARMGAEIVVECARFWASRVEPDGGIRNVIGPDEYAVGVDTNAFTNVMARWVLEQVADRCADCVPEGELLNWRAVAARVRTPRVREDGVIEQYEGYFDRPRGPLTREDAGRERQGTQWLKQADVLMLPLLFPESYTPETLAANFDYYEPRTTHQSSLSHAAYCVSAAMAGHLEQAHRFYVSGASTDLCSKWDTDDGGLHGAASGILVFALLRAFLELRVEGGALRCSTRLPPAWRAVRTAVVWRGRSYDLRAGASAGACVCVQPVNGKTEVAP